MAGYSWNLKSWGCHLKLKSLNLHGGKHHFQVLVLLWVAMPFQEPLKWGFVRIHRSAYGCIRTLWHLSTIHRLFWSHTINKRHPVEWTFPWNNSENCEALGAVRVEHQPTWTAQLPIKNKIAKMTLAPKGRDLGHWLEKNRKHGNIRKTFQPFFQGHSLQFLAAKINIWEFRCFHTFNQSCFGKHMQALVKYASLLRPSPKPLAVINFFF